MSTATALPPGLDSPASPTYPDDTPASPATHRRPWRLLPPDCRGDDLAVGLGPPLDSMTGQQVVVLSVENSGDASCWLGGYPSVRLVDGRNRSMGFHVRPGGPYVGTVPPGHVVLQRGGSAYVKVSKYRCDISTVAVAAAARIRLPGASSGQVVRLRQRGNSAISLCGRQDPPQVVGVSPVRASIQALDPMRSAHDHAAVEMHSRLDPRILPARPHAPATATYGPADLNGDDVRDLVIVRSTGLVSARVSGLGRLTTRVPGDSTLRLQALPDLTGRGRADILLGLTAAGSSGAYVLPDTRSFVLRLVHGRLHQVMWATGRPATLEFGVGRGDLYAGIRCGQGAVRQVLALRGTFRARVTEVDVRISGVTATRHRVDTRSSPLAVGVREAGTRCAAMTSQGWAD